MADYYITLDQFLERLNLMVKDKGNHLEIGAYIERVFPNHIVNTSIHCDYLFPDNELTHHIKVLDAKIYPKG